jgi:hypothetical protein
MDYIEPSQPLAAHNPRDLDLFNPQFATYERFSNHSYYNEIGSIPSYQSEILPSYHSVDRLNINSCLENENIFNPDFIFYGICTVSVCLITGYLRKYYFKSVETPNSSTTPDSPQTFNFTVDQLKEWDQMMDKGEKLNKETKQKLDEDSNYLVVIEFIPDLLDYDEDAPRMELSNPI